MHVPQIKCCIHTGPNLGPDEARREGSRFGETTRLEIVPENHKKVGLGLTTPCSANFKWRIGNGLFNTLGSGEKGSFGATERVVLRRIHVRVRMI